MAGFILGRNLQVNLYSLCFKVFLLILVIVLCSAIASAQQERNDGDVHDWAKVVIQKILTISGDVNTQDYFSSIEGYFSEEGFKKWKKALKASRRIEMKENSNVDTLTVYRQDPIVKNPVNSNNGLWDVDIPVTETMIRDGKKIDNKYFVLVRIKEVQDSSFLIEQIVVSPSYMSAKQRICDRVITDYISSKIEEMSLIERTIFLAKSERNKEKFLDLFDEETLNKYKECNQ